MKKLFFTLALVATFLTANAQNVYWSCYAMKVEDPEGFVKAFDAFMATESGKSLPGVGLSQIQFNNTTNDATHQLCFFSPNPDDLQMLSKFNVIKENNDKFKIFIENLREIRQKLRRTHRQKFRRKF